MAEWIAVTPEQLAQEVVILEALIERLRPALATDVIWQLEGVRNRLRTIPEQNPTVEVDR